MRPIALLDRDGTINVSPDETYWVLEPDGITLLPGAAEAIALLNRAGVPVAVVTNQRGISAGALTEDGLAAITARTVELLAAEGAHADLWLHCPHADGECDCRKPLPGMLLRALEELGGDPATSIMVGDSDADEGAAAAAGVPFARVDAERSLLDAVRGWLEEYPRC